VRARASRGTGCGLDRQYIWTSTPCFPEEDTPNYYHVIKGNGRVNRQWPVMCLHVDETDGVGVRCCADVNIRQSARTLAASAAAPAPPCEGCNDNYAESDNDDAADIAQASTGGSNHSESGSQSTSVVIVVALTIMATVVAVVAIVGRKYRSRSIVLDEATCETETNVVPVNGSVHIACPLGDQKSLREGAGSLSHELSPATLSIRLESVRRDNPVFSRIERDATEEDALHETEVGHSVITVQ